MNGFILKTITLLFVGLLSSATFATKAEMSAKNKKIYSAKIGCMSCHQVETVESDDVSKTSDADQAE